MLHPSRPPASDVIRLLRIAGRSIFFQRIDSLFIRIRGIVVFRHARLDRQQLPDTHLRVRMWFQGYIVINMAILVIRL